MDEVINGGIKRYPVNLISKILYTGRRRILEDHRFRKITGCSRVCWNRRYGVGRGHIEVGGWTDGTKIKE